MNDSSPRIIFVNFSSSVHEMALSEIFENLSDNFILLTDEAQKLNNSSSVLANYLQSLLQNEHCFASALAFSSQLEHFDEIAIHQ